MPIGICPRCRQRFTYSRDNTDYVHECNGTAALSNEDIKVVGNYQDYDGSGTVSKFSARDKPMNNKLQFSEPYVEDCEHLDNKTVRGANKSSTRTRQHLEYIDLSQDCDNK